MARVYPGVQHYLLKRQLLYCRKDYYVCWRRAKGKRHA